MPADGTLVATSHAKTSACPAASNQLSKSSRFHGRKEAYTTRSGREGTHTQHNAYSQGLSGNVWPEAERKLWLQLLEGSFKLIYKDAESPKSPKRSQAEIEAELSRTHERI
jgi:hypothetical protein